MVYYIIIIIIIYDPQYIPLVIDFSVNGLSMGG